MIVDFSKYFQSFVFDLSHDLFPGVGQHSCLGKPRYGEASILRGFKHQTSTLYLEIIFDTFQFSVLKTCFRFARMSSAGQRLATLATTPGTTSSPSSLSHLGSFFWGGRLDSLFKPV